MSANPPYAVVDPKCSDPQFVRLEAALLDVRRRLDAREGQLPAATRDACRGLLALATDDAKARSGSAFVAWDCIHQIDDELLATMSDAERKARWVCLRAEAAEKLKDSWRGKATDALAKDAPEGKPVALHLLRELQGQLATAAQNMQHKLELFQSDSLPWIFRLLLSVVGIALAFALYVYTATSLSEEQLEILKPWAKAIAIGVPAGAIGGILSTAFSLGRFDLKAKIPDMRLSRLVTLTRPLLGAAVAVPVVVFVQAGIVQATGFKDDLAILVFCFVGGFSERWFLSTMERFETGKK